MLPTRPPSPPLPEPTSLPHPHAAFVIIACFSRHHMSLHGIPPSFCISLCRFLCLPDLCVPYGRVPQDGAGR
eukprot:2344157-Prymnesium_polylepis.1